MRIMMQTLIIPSNIVNYNLIAVSVKMMAIGYFPHIVQPYNIVSRGQLSKTITCCIIVKKVAFYTRLHLLTDSSMGDK